MDVTVTIAGWNRADLLERCIRSVLNCEGPLRIEVIVVDNASTDGSVAMLRERFPSVHLIVNSENVGFGRAHNQAFGAATGRYILMLNNDATVLPDTIPTLFKFMEDHPQAGICTCPARPSGQSSWVTGGGVKCFPSITREALMGLVELVSPPFGWANALCDRLESVIGGNCTACEERQVAWAKGALLFVRRTMLDEIGQFDPRFFMYYEETDLCLRAHKFAWAVWQTPRTRYVHDAGQSTALRSDRERIWIESGTAYFSKNQSPRKALLWRCQRYVLQRLLLGLRRAIGRYLRNLLQARSDTPRASGIARDPRPHRKAMGQSRTGLANEDR